MGSGIVQWWLVIFKDCNGAKLNFEDHDFDIFKLYLLPFHSCHFGEINVHCRLLSFEQPLRQNHKNVYFVVLLVLAISKKTVNENFKLVFSF